MKIIDTLLQTIASLPRTHLTLLLAIDGRGGSGKSTLADTLTQSLPNASVVHLDDFAVLPGGADRDRLLRQVITPLEQDRAARYQRFDWPTQQLAEWHAIAPGGIVVVEGLGTLHDLLYQHYDYRIWVECPPEVGFQRGLHRDKYVYGVDTTDKWIKLWMPEEEKYIDEQHPQTRADFIAACDSL